MNRILRLLSSLTTAAVAAVSLTSHAYSLENIEKPYLSAYSYSLYCANNGEFLLSQNGSERLPMASTTKIMTALLALEYDENNGDTVVEITPEMYAEGSSMYLAGGEQLKMKELVGGMLMASGNDAANAVAFTVAGSAEGFAALMNERAAMLDLRDTHFVTPSGLDADAHFSTANDLCVLMAACMENRSFAEIDGQSSITVNFVEPKGKATTYYNENKLLSRYEYCVAGKTGYTDKAGRTLVSCAEKDGVRLTAATLNDGDDWNDHAALFDYGFSLLSMEQPKNSESKSVNVNVVGGAEDQVLTVCGEAPAVVSGGETAVTTEYALPPFVYAPVKAGQKLGELRYYTGGVYAGSAEVTAAKNVAISSEETGFVENFVSFFRAAHSRLQRKKM